MTGLTLGDVSTADAITEFAPQDVAQLQEALNGRGLTSTQIADVMATAALDKRKVALRKAAERVWRELEDAAPTNHTAKTIDAGQLLQGATVMGLSSHDVIATLQRLHPDTGTVERILDGVGIQKSPELQNYERGMPMLQDLDELAQQITALFAEEADIGETRLVKKYIRVMSWGEPNITTNRNKFLSLFDGNASFKIYRSNQTWLHRLLFDKYLLELKLNLCKSPGDYYATVSIVIKDPRVLTCLENFLADFKVTHQGRGYQIEIIYDHI